MEGISKAFGPVQALQGVDLTIEAGTIHAVVGENGAGKTTLMRILYGASRADEGQYFVQIPGSERPSGNFKTSAEAIHAGVGMVSQHYSIIGDLTCLENLILGAEPSWGLSRLKIETRASEIAQRMGFSFDWSAPASTLSPAAAQKLEILKLLWRNSKVMILDEPTAMLSPADADALFDSLKRLASEGSTVIVVTHRLPEVMQHCRHVTVLRGGKRVADMPVADTTQSELAEHIVGHALAPLSPRSVPDNVDDLLTVTRLSTLGERGDIAVKEATFHLLKGEVLGIAGVDGSGQRELFETIIGLRRALQGELRLGGLSILERSILERIDLGVRVIPEDRHEDGVVEDWSLEENAMLGLQRFAPFSQGMWVQGSARELAASAMIDRFKTRAGGTTATMASLSGGNQQRFVAGRALFLTPRLILAFQPSRGLDIDATRNLYEGLYEECAKGAGALVVSFDLDELLQFCDRIVVMNHGKLAIPSRKERGEIGRLMVGAA